MGNGTIFWQNGTYLRWYSNDNNEISVIPLKNFSIAFKLRVEKEEDSDGVIWRCHDLSNKYDDDTANVLRHRVMDDEYKLYIYLIILKIHNCEYNHNRIGTIFRDNPAKLENFNLVHGAYVKLLAENGFGIEYPLPVSVLALLEKTPKMFENPHIRKEMRQICRLAKRRGHTETGETCAMLPK
jgi:hypothetical protein